MVLGPAVAVADGFTPVTNLAINASDEAEAILHDNGTVVDINAYTWAAIATADGYYHLTLQSGISGTVGHMTVVINDDNLILPLRADFTVLEEAVYDRDYKAAATGVDADWTNAGRLDNLLDAVNTVTPDAAGVAPTAVEIQAELEENGASVLDTIRDQIGTAGAGLTDLGGMSTGMKGEVESEANDALVAQRLDHLVAVADADDVVNNSIIARLADSGATADWSAFVQTTDSLRALRDRGDAVWVTATGFNTTVPDAAGVAPTAVEIQAEMEENGASVLDTIRDELANATDGLSALKTLIDAIPTTMVGTDNAALASVVGALNNVAAAGEVTTADTLMQYLKQLINILIGTPGIGAFPAEAAPANAVSLAEVIRAIHADVTGLNGSAMIGTNSANTTVPDAAGTAPTAAEIADDVWDEARSGHVTAGTFGHAFASLVGSTAKAGTLSTTQMSTNLTEATADHYIGRTIVWISGVLAGQASDITDYVGTNGVLTYTAVTEAPSAADEFILF